MTYRIGWLSPLTPMSGVGTFSHAILRDFPSTFNGETVDVTVLYVGHDRLYRSRHRSIQIGESDDFHQILTIFDLLIYNIGNNREHHEPIFSLLRLCPGIVICHDFVYQHYLADVSLRRSRNFAPFAALLLKHGDASATDYLRRSRVTSRTGHIRYSPWDTELSVTQPMSESILALGSALVVHSDFAKAHVETAFAGPVLRLGMPYDQKPRVDHETETWIRAVTTKVTFRLVSFGHIQPTKCIDLVVSALAASPALRRNVRYTIAGFAPSNGYLEQLKAMVAASLLEGVVSFELDVTERRLEELLREADIFVNLRRPNTEGSSVSLIEQLETGKPVIVLDSGCYAEVPSDAAVKLPAQAASDDIKIALEGLIAAPHAMVTTGRAGRAYARSWTCASYATELLRFAFAHRALLQQRGEAVAISLSAKSPPAEPDPWTRDLARARTSLRYLHANVLPIDPSILLEKSAGELCDYAATVIFGIFNDVRLHRALSRFFARLDQRGSYWACVRFALIVEATFGEDTDAQERLKGIQPCYDPEFWAVVETFPPRQHLATAMLILAKRFPTREEFATVSLDDQDGFPKRLRARELIRSFAPRKDSATERLERWLDESCAPVLDHALPLIEQDFECDVGSAAFRNQADLSGFYAMELDHAWTRGAHGFVGLRLKAGAARLEMQVNHVGATLERPAVIAISHGDVTESTKVTDTSRRWLAIDLAGSNDVVWVKFSTDCATPPQNSNDTRPLGICFHKMRVKISTSAQEAPCASISILHDPSGSRPVHHRPVHARPNATEANGSERLRV